MAAAAPLGRFSVVAALVSLLSASPVAAQEPRPPLDDTPPPAPEPPKPDPKPEPEPDPSSTLIPPEPTPGITPAPGAPADPSTNEADKRIGIGMDLTLLIPVGALADATGPSLGPVVRFGYRVFPALEVAMRAGYLFAASKSQGGGVVARFDVLPVWLFARLFLLNPFVGPYVAADLGMNLYLPLREPPLPGPAGDAITEGRWRFGANVGAGYLISTSFPFDLRAQLLMLNLGGQHDKLNEKTHLGIGFSAGYTLQF